MKRILQLVRRNLLAFAIGVLCAIAMGAIFPVFTIGFWQVTYASECVMGPGGSPGSSSVIAFSFGASPSAKLTYKLMYALGNPQGKLYAVIGMRHVDWHEFERMRDELALVPRRVVVHAGCIVESEAFTSALLFDEELQYPDQELRDEPRKRLRDRFEALKKSNSAANQQTQRNASAAPLNNTEPPVPRG